MVNLSFFEFTKLSKENQWEILFKEGVFINSAIHGNIEFVLYK